MPQYPFSSLWIFAVILSPSYLIAFLFLYILFIDLQCCANFHYTAKCADNFLHFSPCIRSDQIRSVAQLCPTLCDPMNRSTPGFPVHHQLPQFTQKYKIRSDQISRSVVSESLRPHESQHARPPCPSPTPGVHSDSRPSSQ